MHTIAAPREDAVGTREDAVQRGCLLGAVASSAINEGAVPTYRCRRSAAAHDERLRRFLQHANQLNRRCGQRLDPRARKWQPRLPRDEAAHTVSAVSVQIDAKRDGWAERTDGVRK